MGQMYFMYIPVHGMADFSLMVTPNQRDRLRRQVMAIRNNRSIFKLDYWNEGLCVEGCIAGRRRYFEVNAKGDVEPYVFSIFSSGRVYEHGSCLGTG